MFIPFDYIESLSALETVYGKVIVIDSQNGTVVGVIRQPHQCGISKIHLKVAIFH
jgi:hypothetical protein